MALSRENKTPSLGVWQHVDPISIKCDLCDKQFSRPDHLRRHHQTHLQAKRIRCSYCEKAFARRDAAQRHEYSHSHPSTNQRHVKLCRTCSVCTKSRIKCSGGSPCSHCLSKDLQCVYLPRKVRKTRFRGTSNPDMLLPAQSPARNARDSYLNTDSIMMGGTPAGVWPENVNDTCWDNASLDQTNLFRGDNGTDDFRGAFTSISQAADEPQVQAQIRSSPNRQITNMQLEKPTQQGMNWLPFDNSAIDGLMTMSPEIMLGQPDAATEDYSPTSIGTTDSRTLEGTRAPENIDSTFRRHDRVSALIRSMRTGSQNSDTSNQITRNSHVPSQQNILYADGAGFRASQADRCIFERQATYAKIYSPDDGHQPTPEWLAVLRAKTKLATENKGSCFEIPEDIYRELLSRLCTQVDPPLLPDAYLVHRDVLLEKATFELFIQLYLDHFHPITPFLDRGLLCIPIWGWSLCLATAAIGTRYLGIDGLTAYGDSLCGILHGLLSKELDFGRAQDSLPYLQARALAAVGLCQSSQGQLMKFGYNTLASVSNSCLQLQLLDEDDYIGAYQEGQDLDKVWLAWRFRETRRRTGLFIWLMDCCLAFATENPPGLPSQKLKLRLPCEDKLWESESPQAWFKVASKRPISENYVTAFSTEETSRVTVNEATGKLWRKVHTQDLVTQFGTVIILHLLIRRRWDVGQYLSQESYTRLPSSASYSTEPQEWYLGAMPEYVKWRNHTCDCLDVLHWEALSLSAKAGGLESPVTLHLHLARLVILSPVQELFNLAHAATGSMTSHTLPHNLYYSANSHSNWRRTILVWAHQDRYKARLAVIHAGAIFWHCRRYSADSFVQPFALFLAALVLWSFGSATKPKDQELPIAQQSTMVDSETCSGYQVSSSERPPSGLATSQSSSSTSSGFGLGSKRRRMPTVMQLDRPLDDELVQYFIRSGEGMRLCLEGVDDLCSTEGLSQVLHEAAAVLLEPPVVWAVSANYAAVLELMVSKGLCA